MTPAPDRPWAVAAAAFVGAAVASTLIGMATAWGVARGGAYLDRLRAGAVDVTDAFDIVAGPTERAAAPDPRRPDVTLYACADAPRAGDVADRAAAILLGGAADGAPELRRVAAIAAFGSVKRAEIDLRPEARPAFAGRTTLIYDARHGERAYAPALLAALLLAEQGTEVATIANTGRPTAWRLSVVVC